VPCVFLLKQYLDRNRGTGENKVASICSWLCFFHLFYVAKISAMAITGLLVQRNVGASSYSETALGVRMRGLGPTMTARGQSIGILIGMLPQTLIMSRQDQLSRLGARIYFFHYS
jgi:hypothetical protein